MKWFKKEITRKEYFGSAVKRKSADTEIQTSLSRMPFSKFELAFITEPVMFSGITTWKDLIYETRPLIYSDDVKVQRKIDWLQKKTQFSDTMYGFAPLHLLIYGNACIELLRKDEKILDLIADDPKQFGFQLDERQRVKFDEYGKPFGYVLKTSIGDISFSTDEMIHLAINQVNRGELGIGLIEPVFKDIELKENIENAKTESAYKQGFPMPAVQFGDEANPPDSEMEATALKIAEDMGDSNTVGIAYPHYYKPKFIEFPVSESLEDTLTYQTKLQSSVLGIPLGVLLQTGESGKGLEHLIDFMECRLKAFQRALRIDEIVSRVLESDGFEPNFVVSWKPLTEKASKEALMRFYRMARVGMINSSDPDAKRIMKEMLGLKSGAPIRYEEVTAEVEE